MSGGVVVVSSLSAKAIRKQSFKNRLTTLLAKYPSFMVIDANNVGSKQLQTIRQSLRGRAEILMGKNTMFRKVLRENFEKHPGLENVMPYIRGKAGLVFTTQDAHEIRTTLMASKVKRAAKAGAVAPVDVVLSAGPTNLEPTKTSFFQALSISTRINKGSISLDNPISVLKAGQRVTHSQAALLQMLNIKPFQYGLCVEALYSDGMVSRLHDLNEEDFLRGIGKAICNVTALSLSIDYSNQLTVLQSMMRALSNVQAVSVEANIPVNVRSGHSALNPDTGEPSDSAVEEDGFASLFDADEEDDGEPVMGLFGDEDDEESPVAADEDAEDVQDMGSLFGDEDDLFAEDDSDSKTKKTGSVLRG